MLRLYKDDPLEIAFRFMHIRRLCLYDRENDLIPNHIVNVALFSSTAIFHDNVKTLSFYDCVVDIDKLPNKLKSLKLCNCTIENIDRIKNFNKLKKLILINNNINNFSFINNLKLKQLSVQENMYWNTKIPMSVQGLSLSVNKVNVEKIMKKYKDYCSIEIKEKVILLDDDNLEKKEKFCKRNFLYYKIVPLNKLSTAFVK